MLTIGKLAAGPTAGRYYVDQVAQGREDYYAGEGEAPGGWIGVGAASLGLEGVVNERGVVRLLNGENPTTGELVGRPLASGSVAGFDLTLRAPKSVGVLFGTCESDVVREITLAHEAAVGEAIGYLEREACAARRGHGGAVLVPGRGFVAAAFRHRSSRAGDPLLHTHVVVANATQGPDGRWTALDGRLLYRHAKAAGYLYQAALRAELTERLGLRWHVVERGTADVVGVPRAVIEQFSQRRAEILKHMAARGESSARAAQVATLETRRRKEYGVPVDRLRDEWRARAAEHGLGGFEVRRVLRRASFRRQPSDPADLVMRLLGDDGLTAGRSSFTRRDVVQAVAEAARDGAHVREIERRADAFLAIGEIVELAPDRGERRYTTRSLLVIERELLERAETRRGARVAMATSDSVRAAVAVRTTLSDEQRELIVALTGEGHGVHVVRAAGGTGKTFALEAAAEAWRRSGIPVVGCALSARAACELRDQAGIDTTTIARLQRALDDGVTLAAGAVLIVDEAGMAGTRDLARLAAATERANAKLVLVGDDRQLPEIDAGGAFRALAERLGATELREARRQREGWDRDALAALRVGRVDEFARAYLEHGRLIAAPTAEAAREALVADWWAAHERGVDALMIAHRRRDVADLNARARERMLATGRLGASEVRLGRRDYAVGDRVVATRNDRALGLVNGEAGVVVELDSARLTVELGPGRRVEVPARYAQDGGLDHGYAVTAHRAQGATVDATFVLGSDELYREWGYTALSRHRDAARFYVSATPAFLNEAPPALEVEGDVARRVAVMLEVSRAQHLALNGISTDHRATRLADDLRREETGLAAIEQRLGVLRDKLEAVRWYQSGRRAEVERLFEAAQRDQRLSLGTVEQLRTELERRPTRQEPVCRRAGDPLAAFERPTAQAARQRRLERARDRDLGLER
jgi:conjugative relaxase-like TrwC/TraI family protein